MFASQTESFLRHAFHEAAVASDHIGVVVNDLFAETSALDFFSHRETDRVRNTLAERTSGHFNAVEQEVLWVASGFRAPLTKVLDLVERYFCVTC